MSQNQSQRHRQPVEDPQERPITYGDVFPVYGDLASKPIAPKDASMMQAAENTVLGQTQKGGPAAVMQSAATLNKRAGLVGHTDMGGKDAMTVTQTDLMGRRVVSESVAGQVLGEFSMPSTGRMTNPTGVLGKDAVTIGEALEAVAAGAGDKVVDQSDAAAIQAAEMRATGKDVVLVGGMAAAAQSAASLNPRAASDGDKIKLGEILKHASTKLPGDTPVTKEDAEGVIAAELRNNPNMSTYPGGVAESMAAAARANQQAGMDKTDIM